MTILSKAIEPPQLLSLGQSENYVQTDDGFYYPTELSTILSQDGVSFILLCLFYRSRSTS